MSQHYYRVAAPKGEAAEIFRESFLEQFKAAGAQGSGAKVRSIKDDFHAPAGHVVLAVDLKGSPSPRQQEILQKFAYTH